MGFDVKRDGYRFYVIRPRSAVIHHAGPGHAYWQIAPEMYSLTKKQAEFSDSGSA